MEREICQHCDYGFQPDSDNYIIHVNVKGDVEITLRCENEGCSEDIEFKVIPKDSFVRVGE